MAWTSNATKGFDRVQVFVQTLPLVEEGGEITKMFKPTSNKKLTEGDRAKECKDLGFKGILMKDIIILFFSE